MHAITRKIVLATLAAACLLASPASAKTRVYNGTPAAVGDAPWSVVIKAQTDTEGALCSGSIIDATHILTAGHCAFDESTPAAKWPVGAYTVKAGIVNDGGGDQSHVQSRGVSAVRVHPGYVHDASADVAVLTLGSALDLSTPYVKAIAVAPEGDVAPVGSGVRIFGWGQTAPGSDVGVMNRLDQTLLRRYQCYSGFSSTLCAQTPASTACPGDSGSGLITVDARPRLIGVASTNSAGVCGAGVTNSYADVTTPEVARWLAGSDTPPIGPRTSNYAGLSGDPRVGGALTCASPAWTDATSVTYQFVDFDTNQVLRDSASPTMVPVDAEINHWVTCVAIAAGPGGTTESVADRKFLVQPPVDPGLYFTFGRNRTIVVRDNVPGRSALQLVFLDDKGVQVKVLNFFDDAVGLKVPSLKGGVYKVCLGSPRQGVYAPGLVCGSWTQPGKASELVTKGKVTRTRKGSFTVRLKVGPQLAGKRVRIHWLDRRCAKCKARDVVRRVKLKRSLTLHSPTVARGHRVSLKAALPATKVKGVPFAKATLNLTIGTRPKK